MTGKVDLSATAQTARIFLFLYARTHRREHHEAATRAVEYLIARQLRTSSRLTNGGLPFGHHDFVDKVAACSWATQFAADAALGLATSQRSATIVCEAESCS